MIRKVSCMVTVLLFSVSLFALVLTVLPANVGATTLYVGGVGPGNYTTIQDAINSSNWNDIIYVHSGVYAEDLLISKTLSLIGESNETTEIRGSGTADVIRVTSDWVNVSGFNITNGVSGIAKGGINLYKVNNCLVENNTFFSNKGRGIYLELSNLNTIIHNRILSTQYEGIHLRGSYDNRIVKNRISDNRVGIYIQWSHYISIFENNISSNSDDGLVIYNSKGLNVTHNDFVYNKWGLFLDSWARLNNIHNNSIFSNREGGILLDGSDMNIINENNISSNLEGFSLLASDANVIRGNNLTDNNRGVYLTDSNGNTIASNNISGSPDGMSIWSSDRNRIENNSVSVHGFGGIELMSSEDNILANNTLHGGITALKLRFSGRNTLRWNRISGADYGIDISESSQTTLTNNEVLSSNFTGIYLSSSGYAMLSSNILVDNGVVIDGDLLEHWNTHVIDTVNTANGGPVYYWKNVSGGVIPPGAGQVILANCTDIIIEGQNITNADAGIQIAFTHNSTISNNSVSSGKWNAILLHYSDNNEILQNSLWNSSKGISLQRSHDNIAIGNGLSNNDQGIRAQLSNRTVIRNNTAFNSRLGGIVAMGCPDTEITGNNVTHSGFDGIGYHYSTNGKIANNTVSESKYGIDLFVTFDTTIEHNLASYNQDGIVLSDAEGVVIRNNTVSLNIQNGIRVGSSWFDAITDNFVYSNSECGIRVDFANHINITNNSVISNNEYGVCLYGSSLNSIYHNNFTANGNQAYDDENNTWDNGYPSGGNYWSDYTGPDEFSGPDQDQPGYDGIGDTPQIVYGGQNEDRYPLMHPSGGAPPYSPYRPRFPNATGEDGQVVLNWTAPIFDGGAPITNYIIYRGTSPGTATYIEEIGNVLSYTDTGLTNGQVYYYQVSAKNAVGEGSKSIEINSIPGAEPGPPFDLVALAGKRNVTLTWSSPLDDGGFPVTSYHVYRGTSSGVEVFLTALGNNLEFVDTGLTAGTEYFYRVSAANSMGEGARSNEASATPTHSANQVPSCSITEPFAGDIISDTYSITGSATDSDGMVQRVEIRIDEGGWIEASGNSSWSYLWDTTTVEDGDHTIHVRSFDGEFYSTDVFVTVKVDNSISGGSDDWLFAALALSIVILAVMVMLVYILYKKRRIKGEEESIEPILEGPS